MKCFSRLVLAYTVSCFSLGAVAFAAAEQQSSQCRTYLLCSATVHRVTWA